MYKTTITVRLQVEGLHYWPQAKEILPEMGYLSLLHRHMFHIEANREVSHDDRDVEIIMFKRTIADFLVENYFDKEYECCNFGAMSCEMLARILGEQFDLESCSVLEDNENGATVSRTNI